MNPPECKHSTDTAGPLQFQCPQMESHCSHTHGPPTGDQAAQSLSVLKTSKKSIECLCFFFIPVSHMSIFNKYWSEFSLDLLLLTYFNKSISCCLTALASFNSELWLFMSSPCIYEPQLCNLCVKPDLASRDHIMSFSSWGPWWVPCSAKLIFCPACLTSDTVEVPAPMLLKDGS